MKLVMVPVPIQTQLAPLLKGGNVGKALTERILANTTTKIVTEWVNAIDATANRKSWGNKYADSISVRRIGKDTVQISAGGLYANLVEEGVESWDMRKILHGKRFRRVPFQHFGHGVESSAAMPKKIWELAKELRRGQMLEGIRMKKWERERGYTASIYEGMSRRGARGHSQYMTFRTLSFKSPPDKWIYPQIEATPVFRTVSARAPRWADQESLKVLMDSASPTLREMLGKVGKPNG